MKESDLITEARKLASLRPDLATHLHPMADAIERLLAERDDLNEGLAVAYMAGYQHGRDSASAEANSQEIAVITRSLDDVRDALNLTVPGTDDPPGARETTRPCRELENPRHPRGGTRPEGEA